MEYLTPQQIQKIKEIFSVYDFSNEGLVDDKELGTTLRILGVQATEAEIKDMIAKVDQDGSGKLDVIEYTQFLTSELKDVDLKQEMKETFEEFDCDKDGGLSAEDLVNGAKKLGIELSMEDAREMVTEASAGQASKLSLKNIEDVLTLN